MTIRLAKAADARAVLLMGLRFFNESSYKRLAMPSRPHLAVLVDLLISNEAVFVAEALNGDGLVGFFAATIFTHPMTGEPTGTEIAWWIEPEHRGGSAGIRLWEAGEAWARGLGATSFQMIAPAGNLRVGDLYRRRGYHPLEMTYVTLWV